MSAPGVPEESRSESKGPISLTVDVDGVCHYLRAYGTPDPECGNITYNALLPRFSEFFDRWKTRATFFVTGDHLQRAENRAVLKGLAEAGHEIANHTFSHPPRFSLLNEKEKRREIADAEGAIEDATSARPVGFRAPAWDIDDETIGILQERGYRYDSSCLPFAVTTLRLFLLGLKTRSLSTEQLKKGPHTVFPPARPYQTRNAQCWRSGHDDFLEIPMTVLPVVRMPFMSTWLFQWGRAAAGIQTRIVTSLAGPIQFGMHALDLIDLSIDRPDGRLKQIGHPVLKRDFSTNRGLLERILSALLRGREVITLREQASRILGGKS